MKKITRKKLVVIGDGCCGKTCLLHVYQNKKFPEGYVPTVFENYIMTVKHESGKSIELSLWDTAGQEEYDRLRPLCYPETDVILICFAIDQIQSFTNVQDKWVPELDHFLFNTPRLLVGTKKDLRGDKDHIRRLNMNGQKLISTREAEELAKKIGTQYIECSAKENDNVKEVIDTATGLILNNRRGKISKICILL
ncbi:ras-like protein family, member Ab [Parasitella parasitica]|nr:ras-like protein family, member Ab [Parasitella parasitica]